MEERFFAPVDVVQNVSPKAFKKAYLHKEKPVILRGLWSNFPASKKWTVDFFKSQLGNIEVGVFDVKLQKEDRSFKQPDYKMKFADYLDLITSDRDSNVRLFLFNIFKYKPELKNDFSYPQLTRSYIKIPFMFFGGKNSKVRIHQDMDWSNVFLTQLYGRKEVFLFHPKYSKLLYRYPFGVHSSVNIDQPDYQKYPGLQYVNGLHCIMEPGDTLFIPGGYWHYIKYHDGGFAINQRALSPNPINWLRGLWNVAILSNLDDLFRKFLGDRWFSYKTSKAQQNADKAIARMKNPGNPGKFATGNPHLAKVAEKH